MNVNRSTKLLVVAIALIILAVPTAGFAFAAVNTAPTRMTTDFTSKRGPGAEDWGNVLPLHRGFSPSTHWRPGPSGNVTIDANRAKTLVDASIPSLKVGTVTSFGTSWVVPIEDAKGVVTSIQVTKVSASTDQQAKSMVEISLKNGWKTGDPKLAGTTYNVPLLDSNNAAISYARVDGKNGEIMRRPSTVVTVTSDQAKTKVNDAIKEFKVGDANDRGNVWTVSIKYKDKVVMTVLLGKLNTPTSDAAVKAVQGSMNSWKAGEPKQLQSNYNVPIIDANGNTVSNIRVDGRTGDITAGFPSPSR